MALIGESSERRYLKASEFTGDFGQSTWGPVGGVEWGRGSNGAEEVNTDIETVLRSLS